jgi:hypothetical protein
MSVCVRERGGGGEEGGEGGVKIRMKVYVFFFSYQ